MDATILSTGCKPARRLLVLGAALLALGGCATGYSLVQPDVRGAGAYYTGGAYANAGYGGAWSAGGYYAGPYGFGDYAGWPYGVAGGGYGPGFAYGSPFALGFGVSTVWGFPGYWDPWYVGGRPVWACGWRCHSHRGQYWRQRGNHGAMRGRPWRGMHASDANPRTGHEWRHTMDGRAPMGADAFARRAFVHAPTARPWTNADVARPAAPRWRGRPVTRGVAEGMPRFAPPAFRSAPALRAEPAFRAAPRFAPAPAIRAQTPRPAARDVGGRRAVR